MAALDRRGVSLSDSRSRWPLALAALAGLAAGCFPAARRAVAEPVAAAIDRLPPPPPGATPEVEAAVMERIIRPTVARMAQLGCPFKGVLYAGLMITDEGPKLIEYNVRFGDPEAQVMMARLMSDLVPALLATRDGTLGHVDLRWWPKAAVSVVMATRGYPGSYPRDTEIGGIEAAGALDDVTVFHAGTKRDGARLLSSGGRVLGVTALGDTIAAAQAQAYRAVDAIAWPDGFCRRDIGWRALGR